VRATRRIRARAGRRHRPDRLRPAEADRPRRDVGVPPNYQSAYFLLGTTVFGTIGVALVSWHLAREHRRRAAGLSG
jgi:hypothetical protein